MGSDFSPAAAPQALLFDTAALGAPEEGFARFCALIDPICAATALGEIADFRVRSQTLHLGPAVLIESRTSTLRYDRTLAHIARGIDHFQLSMYLSGGTEFVTGACTALQRPGDVALIDMAQPSLTREIPGSDGHAEVMTFMLPRMLLMPLLTAPEALPAIILLPRDALEGATIGRHMLALRRDAPELTQAESQAMVHRLMQRVAAAVAALTSDKTPSAARSPEMLRARVRRHIEDNLGAATLGIESLCRQFGLSRATLYRVLAPESPASYIQERRLHRAFAMLISPAFRSWRILDVALECHFSSDATFVRAFRRQFGITPGEARERAGHLLSGAPVGSGPPSPQPDAESVRWVTTLTGAMPQLDAEERSS